MASRDESDDGSNSHSHSADTWTSAHDLGIRRDALESVHGGSIRAAPAGVIGSPRFRVVGMASAASALSHMSRTSAKVGFRSAPLALFRSAQRLSGKLRGQGPRAEA